MGLWVSVDLQGGGSIRQTRHPGYVTCTDVLVRSQSRVRRDVVSSLAWRKTPTINLPLDEAEAMLMATLSLADWQNLFPIQTGPEVED